MSFIQYGQAKKLNICQACQGDSISHPIREVVLSVGVGVGVPTYNWDDCWTYTHVCVFVHTRMCTRPRTFNL